MILLAVLGFYAYRQHYPMLLAKAKSSNDNEVIPLTKPDPEPIKPKPQSQLIKKPLTIARILADNIKPDKEEYAALKDQDMRMHTLRFSQNAAKKCSSLNMNGNDSESKPISLNRCSY